MSRFFSFCTLVAGACLVLVSCSKAADDPPQLHELQRVKSGTLDVVLLSPRDAVHQGKDEFVLEFRSSADQKLVDVGTVKINATMPMAGMAPMLGVLNAARSETGRYSVTSDLGMSGTWRMAIEWNGPQGQGSAVLSTSAQ